MGEPISYGPMQIPAVSDIRENVTVAMGGDKPQLADPELTPLC
jgi:hypothetical protein